MIAFVTDAEVQILKYNQDKIVEIVCKDGEIMTVKVISVSEPENDVIYDLISTEPARKICGSKYSRVLPNHIR